MLAFTSFALGIWSRFWTWLCNWLATVLGLVMYLTICRTTCTRIQYPSVLPTESLPLFHVAFCPGSLSSIFCGSWRLACPICMHFRHAILSFLCCGPNHLKGCYIKFILRLDWVVWDWENTKHDLGYQWFILMGRVSFESSFMRL